MAFVEEVTESVICFSLKRGTRQNCLYLHDLQGDQRVRCSHSWLKNQRLNF